MPAYHPYADIFPLMEGEEFDGLATDIQANGLRDAIVLFEGEVLDGRNRLRACASVGVEPRFEDFEGTDDDALGFVVSRNIHRRHLSSGQRAALAVTFIEEERALAVVRQKAGVEPHDTSIRRSGPVREILAEKFDTNPVYIDWAGQLADDAPDLFEDVRAGRQNLKQANAESKTRQTEADPLTDEEKALGKRIAAGETVVVNIKTHARLIARVAKVGKYERIDRGSKWGNPFLLDADGDRETVIESYSDHYLPHKPSLLEGLDSLKGKALGCWCAPLPCHGDALVGVVEE